MEFEKEFEPYETLRYKRLITALCSYKMYVLIKKSNNIVYSNFIHTSHLMGPVNWLTGCEVIFKEITFFGIQNFSSHFDPFDFFYTIEYKKKSLRMHRMSFFLQ